MLAPSNWGVVTHLFYTVREHARREPDFTPPEGRYTDRLAEAGLVGSVGSVGDSYDNAMAESIIGLFKTEVIRRCGPWRNVDEVGYAVLEWVDWFNNKRLYEPLGYASSTISYVGAGLLGLGVSRGSHQGDA